MKNIPINERIKETSIYIFSKNSQSDLFTYSRPLVLEESNAVAEAVNRPAKDEYGNPKGLRDGLSVDEKTAALTYVNTFKGILANRELSRQSKNTLRFSTPTEGLLLHQADMLPSGVVMDFGLVLYNVSSPNKEIAQSLALQAQKKKYSLPILASFPSLGLEKGGKEYGVTPQLISEVGLVSGKDATNLLKKHNFYFGNLGVQRLSRDRNGDWNAGWDYLGISGAGFRVGRVSGEASAKNLKEMVNAEIKRNFEERKIDLQSKLQALETNERKVISSAEEILNR